MIPFDVDPVGYYFCAMCCVCILVSAIAFYIDKNPSRVLCGMFMEVFMIFLVSSFFIIMFSSAYTDTITICAHTSDRGSMTVIDTNQNMYYVNDQLTQFKVKDNETIKVKIENTLGIKYIYSIDAPIACGNQTCGVAT